MPAAGWGVIHLRQHLARADGAILEEVFAGDVGGVHLEADSDYDNETAITLVEAFLQGVRTQQVSQPCTIRQAT